MYAHVIRKAFDTCTDLTITIAALAAINIFLIVPAIAIVKRVLSS